MTTIPGNASYFPLLLRWFGPPLGPSDALGVGKKEGDLVIERGAVTPPRRFSGC